MMKINFISLILFVLTFSGCSSDRYDEIESKLAGNKPPSFFHFSNANDANHYIFHQQSFDISMIQSKTNDWIIMKGWKGTFNKRTNDEFTLYLEPKAPKDKGGSIRYHVFVSSSKVSKYSERDRAIDKYNIEYIQNRIHKYRPNTKVTIKDYGKEKYPCVVTEYANKGFKNTIKKGITYRCYKFNPAKTKAKDVLVALTYTKASNLPNKYKNLAKEFTYQDLQRRAKRMLDSLYIKDGWSE